MANLIFDFYENEGNYSDGEIEKKMLEYLKSGNESIYEEIKDEWAYFYHFTHLRHNILNWYEFKENANILEVGAGCGALTALLCEKAASVTSVELTKMRSEILYQRHKDFDNLDIYVGNFNKMKFGKKFDYIILNGVFEYAATFTEGDKPFETFLKKLGLLLNEGGSILIAIENRFGLKYFAGAREDHNGKFFYGINGYNKEDYAQTFNKEELKEIITSSGFTNHKFYYPYPDYKLPDRVYADLGIDKLEIKYSTDAYDQDRYELFDENNVNNELVKIGIASEFSNSFLVQLSKAEIAENKGLIFVKLSANRSNEFRIGTKILKEESGRYIEKFALTQNTKSHIKKMYSNEKSRKKLDSICFSKGTLTNNESMRYEYIEGETIGEKVRKSLLENHGDTYVFLEYLHKYVDIIKTDDLICSSEDKAFLQQMFGYEDSDMSLHCSTINDYDFNFDNIIDTQNSWVSIDHEWLLERNIPFEFLVWRVIWKAYYDNEYLLKNISLDKLLERFNISNLQNEIFAKWEMYFVNKHIKLLDLNHLKKAKYGIKKTYFSNVYYDTGDGFNENEKHEYIISLGEKNEIEFELDPKVISLRFDPIEGILTEIESIEIKINENSLDVTSLNGYKHKEKIIFLNRDPMFIIENIPAPGEDKKIKIEYVINEIEVDHVKDLLEELERKIIDDERKTIIYKERKEDLEKKLIIADNNLSDNTVLIQRLKCEKANLEEKIVNISHESDRKDKDALELIRIYNEIINSRTWKIGKPVRIIFDNIKTIKNKLREFIKIPQKVMYVYKNYGFKETILRVKSKGKKYINNYAESQKIAKFSQSGEEWETFEKWLYEKKYDFIDIFHVPMGWGTPLFQRFQHLSIQAGVIGGIGIYGAHPLIDKDVKLYKFINDDLCIVNLDNYAVKVKLFEILDNIEILKIIRLQSIDTATSIEEISKFIDRGYKIVYEYIDEITSDIIGVVPKSIFSRHEYILKNEQISVVATSDKLYSQIKSYRCKNMAMINNGVDVDFWKNIKSYSIPDDMKMIAEQRKTIVGYHGALAKWIDYDILKNIANDGRYSLVLIGHEHDDSLKKSGLVNMENVYFLGSKSYFELNRYAYFYDIGILPFLINDVTLSVSPVKIFEYMAAGKPVVSTPLPECLKYRSCLCSSESKKFLSLLEKAVELKGDTEYLDILQKEAKENSWKSIMEKTLYLVKENLKVESAKDIVSTGVVLDKKERYISEVLAIPSRSSEYIDITKNVYKRLEGDCKVIAYYLTQFHPDPHNEQWWGKGVTEWNNVSRAVPQYIGHYQPRLPGELGFYDLRIKENMERQVELAQMYGIYGFSFYYYWFNGERLLERPLEEFLTHSDIDFPFSLCWANENWTKRFDGTSLDILMEQPKSIESYKAVIHDMIRFFKDKRYIEIKGKKLLTIYRPDIIPESELVLNYWRDYCRKMEIGELYIVAVKVNGYEDDLLSVGYDALSEFHPGTLYQKCKRMDKNIDFVQPDFGGEILDYKDIVEKKRYFEYDYDKLYRAAMPMWDNTARRNNKGMIFHGAEPNLYEEWLIDIMNESKLRKDLDDNLIFINAWNEWGEGAYLEPDKKYGYAYLQATKNAIERSR